jgi:hypothetical protein
MPARRRRPFNRAARHSSTRNKPTHYDKYIASCGEHIFYFLFTRRYPPPLEAARTHKLAFLCCASRRQRHMGYDTKYSETDRVEGPGLAFMGLFRERTQSGGRGVALLWSFEFTNN